jgi:hypothetical protein
MKGKQYFIDHLDSHQSKQETDINLSYSFSHQDILKLKEDSHFQIPHSIEHKDHLNCFDLCRNELSFINFVSLPLENLTCKNLKKLKGVCLFYQYLDSSSWSTYKHVECVEIFDVMTSETCNEMFQESNFETDHDVAVLKKISSFYRKTQDNLCECMMEMRFFNSYYFEPRENYSKTGHKFWLPKYIYQKIFQKSNFIEKDELFIEYKYDFNNMIENKLIEDTFSTQTVAWIKQETAI